MINHAVGHPEELLDPTACPPLATDVRPGAARNRLLAQHEHDPESSPDLTESAVALPNWPLATDAKLHGDNGSREPVDTPPDAETVPDPPAAAPIPSVAPEASAAASTSAHNSLRVTVGPAPSATPEAAPIPAKWKWLGVILLVVTLTALAATTGLLVGGRMFHAASASPQVPSPDQGSSHSSVGGEPSTAVPPRSTAHDSPAPSRGQSGGPTGPAPTTPRTGGAGAVAEDPERHNGVEQERTVELDQQPGYNWVDIEYWRQDPSTPGELEIDSSQIKTNLGARLAIIADTPLANRARCAQVTEWRDSIRFSELHEGSQLCGKSRVDRYAALQVKVLPTSSASNGRFIFHGITWY